MLTGLCPRRRRNRKRKAIDTCGLGRLCLENDATIFLLVKFVLRKSKHTSIYTYT